MCFVWFTRETCCCVFLCCSERYKAARPGLSPVSFPQRSPGASRESLAGTQ
ncbi:unnamed protein product, partial [Staurois parvus]